MQLLFRCANDTICLLEDGGSYHVIMYIICILYIHIYIHIIYVLLYVYIYIYVYKYVYYKQSMASSVLDRPAEQSWLNAANPVLYSLIPAEMSPLSFYSLTESLLDPVKTTAIQLLIGRASLGLQHLFHVLGPNIKSKVKGYSKAEKNGLLATGEQSHSGKNTMKFLFTVINSSF